MLSAPWRLASGLLAAADHLSAAEDALQKTAMKEARYETLAGEAAAARARSGLDAGGPVFDLGEGLPVIGDVLGEADHLVRAAELSSEAAAGTLDVAQNALRGPDKVIAEDEDDPKGGAQIRLDRIVAIGRTISAVRTAIEGVERELRQIKIERLPKRVRGRVTDGIDKAQETDEVLAKAEAGFEILPGLLGADGPRMYMFGMQNSAEQRGPGGALLQFKLMQIVDGKPELLKAAGGTIYNIDKDRQQISIPIPADAWYVRGIPDAQRFGNANWSPDWPLSAQLTLDYAKASTPEFPEVDGAFAVDPILMQKLMPGVGQFHTTVSGRRGNYITANRILHFLIYKAYASYPIPRVRRNHLEAVVDDFYEHMVKPKHPTELAQGFGDALAEKHMQMWFADPKEQAFAELMDWDGAIEPAPRSDYLYVVEQNVGGNKLDYFADNSTTYNVQFDGDDVAVTTSTTVENRVFLPQPIYPMGDSGKNINTNGFHRPMMNIYVPETAELRLARVEGTRLDNSPPGLVTWPASDRPAEHLEKGKKVWSTTLEIPPGKTGTFELGYVVPDVVRTVGGRKVYTLTIQRQPRVRPDRLIIGITLPEGASGIKARGFKRNGGVLEYDRPLKRDTVLEVSWRE